MDTASHVSKMTELQTANSLDTYKVEFANGQNRVLTRNCLLHNYLNNSLNRDSVINFEKEPEQK